ncbi:hypothetical protein ACIRQF_31370 [Streptomyces sp. NPDC101191]|uniref:hypothetical protein n=1 Tax=Streptomyces sp. NPDC101191 TaxID=3366126 RepID=UPI003802BE17
MSVNNVVDVLLFAALALGALWWALDLGTHKSRLVFLTCVVGAINVSAIWQTEAWYVVAIYGALTSLLLSALRRESVRRKSAPSTTTKPKSRA